jgi:hypothetical protein
LKENLIHVRHSVDPRIPRTGHRHTQRRAHAVVTVAVVPHEMMRMCAINRNEAKHDSSLHTMHSEREKDKKRGKRGVSAS